MSKKMSATRGTSANEAITESLSVVHVAPPQYSDEAAREEIVQSVATEVMGRMLSCGSCKYWARTGPSFGQCMLSGKYGSSPIITTDKASCSSWIE